MRYGISPDESDHTGRVVRNMQSDRTDTFPEGSPKGLRGTPAGVSP